MYLITINLDMELLQFFTYKHLPPHLQEISKPFASIAERMVQVLPENIETNAMLRKLLEAKDCAIRSKLLKSGV